MSHLRPQYYYGVTVLMTHPDGSSYLVPSGPEVDDLRREGWLRDSAYEAAFWTRLTADGFLDQTEWEGPFATEAAARAYHTANGIDPDTGDDLPTKNRSIA